MGSWKIEIFENADDPEPSRTEIVPANSEAEAVEAVLERLRDSSQRGDATAIDSTFRLGDQLDSTKKLG